MNSITHRIIFAVTLLLGAGDASSLKAAPFTDANWASPGSANGTVHATAVDGSGNLYIGDSFTAVEGVNATNIAKWNGISWSALGLGLKGTVYALAAWGSNVYAGGSFTTADGSPGNYIAQWNGSWSAMGSGMNSYVYALAVSSNFVYAGGDFSTAGGGTARNVAAWNGSSWSAMGPAPASGMNGGPVFGLATSGNDLYAVGAFTVAGGLQCNGSR